MCNVLYRRKKSFFSHFWVLTFAIISDEKKEGSVPGQFRHSRECRFTLDGTQLTRKKKKKKQIVQKIIKKKDKMKIKIGRKKTIRKEIKEVIKKEKKKTVKKKKKK